MYQAERLPLMMDSKIDKATKNRSGAYNLGFDDSDLHDAVDQKEYWDDEFDEDSILLAENVQRGTTLIWNDFFISVLEYIQWLAVIQATGLKWPLPADWITYTSWIFGFNLDLWEFIKIYTADQYKSVQGYVTDSTLMPVRFLYLLIGWGVVLFLLMLSYFISHLAITKSRHPFLLTKIAKLQRAYIIFFQILSLPIGMVVGKMFHCALPVGSDVEVMDVANENTCFNGIQLAYAAVCLVVALPFYLVFSIWLIKKTKLEIIFAHAKGHEAYLQLKETEYARGLDIMYVISSFHIFSSFRLRAVHYRAALHLLKFVLIIVYAAAHSYPYAQAVTMAILMFGYWIGLTILRPYRVKVFNVQLIINYLLLTLQLLIGALRTSFDVYSIRSAWFTPTYTHGSLIILNGIFVITNLTIFIYLILHQCNVIKTPLWPTMTSQGVEKLGQHTQKYMRAVLRARHVVERSLSLPALFAPAHELSRQIQIINAYCREAEMLDDPLQDTLWHLLDELIETHSKIAPRSLFADSVKDSIRSTATELMALMPSFVQRLSQREYDFLLVTPLKRRVLLKMFCLGMFLSKIKKDPDAKLNKSALQVVWNKKNHKRRENANYIAELQPQTEDRPGVNVTAANKRREQLLSDTVSVDSMVFDGRESTVVDIDEMMAGVPSRPSTATRSGSNNGSPPRSDSALSDKPSRPGTAASRGSRPGTSEGRNGRPAQPSLLRTALVKASRPGSAQVQARRPGSAQAGVPATAEVEAETGTQDSTKVTEL